MKKEGFPQFSSILLMLPLQFIAMNTLHSFFDPTVYVLCRKLCEYKSYTGMKNRSERKFPCRVHQENQLALVIEFIKNSYKKFWITLLMPT